MYIGNLLEKELRIMIVKMTSGSWENKGENARSVYQRLTRTEEQTSREE